MPRPLVVCALLAALTACSNASPNTPTADLGTPRADASPADASPADASPTDASPADAPPADADAAVPAVEPPDTPVGMQLAWLLSVLNGDPSAVDEATVAQHLAPTILRFSSAAAIVRTLVAIAQGYGQLTLLSIQPGATDRALVAIVRSRNGLYLRLPVNTVKGLISDFRIESAPELDPALTDWSMFDRRFAAVAPRARMIAGEVTSGTCTTLHGVDATTPGPLGAESPLWVLATLASQIAGGMHTWSEPLTVRNAWRSLPPVTTGRFAVGSSQTLQQFALAMIFDGNDTAGDHLLRTVGREQVEAMLTTTRHARPALNVPFLTTREYFQLKLGVPAAEQMTYLAGDAARRRAYLDTTLAPMNLDAAYAGFNDWTSPIRIDDLGWFGSPTDVCNVFAHIRTLGEAPGGDPVLRVFPIIPGLVDASVFPYVAYVTGGEPGVFSRSYLLRRNDGRWFVVSTAYSDPMNAIDGASAAYFAAAAVKLAERL
jgi:hypothetical protein